MYLVKRCFANSTISASKGKVIEIKDKKLASSLLESGYIVPFSKKDMSSKEKDDEIGKLNTEIQSLKNTISLLETEKATLSAEMEQLKSSNDESSDDSENLDNSENLENSTVPTNEDLEKNPNDIDDKSIEKK